ncbi:hypothetical protein EV421DRAFT_2024796 [Armillaria borealis]|uniref:Heterokaryon incompatibility domain-containing protein n=1 Tax=Armillaria borealis TaxID=47425 RepID=A0AA39MDN0_9AGAR|nr:hypothetical protein EV421DRAFT_2024796 [Armillaria borealis]
MELPKTSNSFVLTIIPSCAWSKTSLLVGVTYPDALLTGSKRFIKENPHSDTPCKALGVAGLLERLNAILGTSHTLYGPRIYSLLEVFLTQDLDFGTAYAHLRPFWYHDLTDVKDELRIREERDSMMREDVLVKKRIIDKSVPPRRVWDLYSNRVVPWWVARQCPWAISHAWVEEKDRGNVLTPINGFEWPVPIPKDTNLDLIRIEMLNAGAEYAWLDVLCLRQVDGKREDLRAKEWKVDVPTIGWAYSGPARFEPIVYYYFNGLGRPLRMKAGDFESDRSWFKRVWTLQEFSHRRLIGGDTGDDYAMAEEVRAEFDQKLLFLEIIGDRMADVFTALSYMRHRVCTNPIDKIAGMVYLLSMSSIPAYYEMQSIEDAWTALVDMLNTRERGNFFFAYPKPGNGNKAWRPSWNQAMDDALTLPPWPRAASWADTVKHTEDTDADWIEADCIESGYVQGLAEGLHDGAHRYGELTVKDYVGASHTFKIRADHQYRIPDGLYALVGSHPFPSGKFEKQRWVIGRRLPEGKFEKVSVFHIPDHNEVKRLYELYIDTYARTFLVWCMYIFGNRGNF